MRDGKPPEMSLTDDQKKTVKELLGKYDLKKLTADQANAIFKSFKNFGKRKPGVMESLKETGLDPEKFWSLAYDGQSFPPAPPKGGYHMPPPGEEGHRPPPFPSGRQGFQDSKDEDVVKKE